MKTLRYIFIFMAAVTLAACSLEEDRTSVSDPDNYFRNFVESQSVVNSCYMPMRTMYNGTFFLAVECVSDLMYCSGSGQRDAQLEITPATPRYGATGWTQAYSGVSRCNYAIHGIENADADALTDEQRVQLLCEAKALRGFYYLYLTSMFGDVPFYFDYVQTLQDQDRIGRLGRMPANATRDSIIVDLQKIAPLVDQTRTSDNKECRVGAALAYMIIAKCAMWNAADDSKYWSIALDALKEIEAIYGDFAQYQYEYNVLFRNKNTPESILEVQHKYEQGGISYVSNLASFCTPTKRVVNEIAYFDGVEIPEIGAQATTYSPARPNQSFVVLQPRKGSDIRAHVNMAWGYGGKDFDDTKSGGSGKPFLGPKFWCPDLQATYDGNNYKVYRYADAILMMAECYYELNDNDLAVQYLNKTRTRAGLQPYEYKSRPRLIDEIRTERGRELFGEFQRKFDLVRWGIWEDKVMNNSDYSSLKNRLQPCHRYYPIPDTEVVDSKYNLDNKEYEAYGF